MEIKSEIDEEPQYYNLENNLEDLSDYTLVPATRKESSESNVTQKILH